MILVSMLFLLQALPAQEAPESAVAVFPSGDEFVLELAVTPEQRRIGYMNREDVGSREGMLFLFGRDGLHSIWMKNCRVPLDILWLDRSFRVVHVEENLPPCPVEGPCPSSRPSRPARYVLELAGGRVRETGLRPGDRVVILSDPPIR